MLQKIFKLKDNNTTAKTEIIAGISTFFTLAFIIAVNPAILSDAGI
ncbi:MAG: NCS2 family permease, partial [Alphaproteobacteria bacterium]|nr:NCS2 family permease [Alphaproteobacteria bacterium]